MLWEIWPVCIGSFIVVSGRLALSSNTPQFTVADNPAAHAPEMLTRVLSIAKTWATHGRLLILPSTLSFDWSMGAVPLITSVSNSANLETAFLILVLISISVSAICSLWAQRPTHYQNNHHHKSRLIHNSHTLCHDALNNNNVTCVIDEEKKIMFKKSFCHTCPPHQIVMGLGLLVIPFLPASNIPAWVGFVVAERILYLPSMGMSLLLALGAHKLWLTSSLWPSFSSPSKLRCLFV